MSVVLVFAMAYISLDDSVSHSDVILGLVATSAVVGYLGLHVYNRTGLPFALYLKDLQHVSIFLLFSFSLSPVLYKLT